MFDGNRMRQTMDNSRELFEELLSMLVRDVPLQMQQLRNAIEQCDFAAVHRAAHTLQGMVGLFAATRAQEAAVALQTLAGCAPLEAAGAEMEDAMAELQTEVRAYRW